MAAKELERQLGVTYKTAWRMAHLIRKHMSEVDDKYPSDGIVEADETYIGGKQRGRGSGYKGNKTIVFGLAERGGGVMTKVVPNVKRKTLQPIIEQSVAIGSEVHTSELPSYSRLEAAGY